MIDIDTLLNDHQSGMSEYQDDYLVTTRAGGTLYGQYKQSLREMYKRLRGLRQGFLGPQGLQRLLLKIKYLTLLKYITYIIPYAGASVRVILSYCIERREEMERSIFDNYREFNRFYQQASALKKIIGDITPDARRTLERELWRYRVKEMAACDYMQHGRLKDVTIQFLTSMPKQDKSDLMPLIFGDEVAKQKLIDDYIFRTTEVVEYEDIPLLDIPEIWSAIKNVKLLEEF